MVGQQLLQPRDGLELGWAPVYTRAASRTHSYGAIVTGFFLELRKGSELLDDDFRIRNDRSFLFAVIRQMTIVGCDSDNWAIERLERLLGEERRDFGADAERLVVLVENGGLAGLADARG